MSFLERIVDVMVGIFCMGEQLNEDQKLSQFPGIGE